VTRRVPAHANRVIERGSGGPFLEMRRHVLLDDGAQGLDAPGLADIGKFGEAVCRAHDIGPQPQLRGSEPISLGWGLCLHPVLASR
jgi:hypothetical protein